MASNNTQFPPIPSAAFFKRLLAGILLTSAFVVALAAYWLYHSRAQDLDDDNITSRNLAQVLEQHLVGTVRGIDLAMLTVADEYARQMAAGGIDERAMAQLLAQQQAHLPELESLRIADAGGAVRHGPGIPAGTPINIADRDYFIAARDDAEPKLLISKPLFARISKKWVIAFARRLDRPDGSFGGVVYVNLALEHLSKSFATLDVGPRGAIILRDGELGVIARHPEPQGAGSIVGSKVAAHMLQQMIGAGNTEGTFIDYGGIDHIERTFSYRKVGAYPFYIVVGLATDDTLAEWQRSAARIAALVGLFLLMALVFSRLLFLAWRRQVAGAEILLREKEKFHTVADYTYDWEYWHGPDQREIFYMTPSCERITGYTEGEFVADPGLLLRIVHPDDRRPMEEHLHDCADTREGTLDFRIVRRDGEVRWISHACRPVFAPDGGFQGRRVSNRDITDRKQIERALREAEARSRSSFEAAAIGMALVSVEGRFVEVNSALCRIVGYPPDELKRKSFQDITHPDDLEADLAHAKRLAAGECASYQMEKRYFHQDGHIVWILLTGSTVRDEQGRLLYFVAQIQDITERKHIGEALRRSEEFLKGAQRIAQLGSWELDLATNALTWSDEIFRIFEIDPEKFGASYDAFLAAVHPEDRERVNQAYAASVKNRLPYEITHRLLLPDGTIKYVHEHCETFYGPDGKAVRSVGTVQDVTLRVLNEEAMRESEERFRTIADYTYDWEYWQGPQGEFLYISPSCKRVTGYSQADFISDPDLVYKVIHPDDRRLMDDHRSSIVYEDDGSLDFRIVTKEGEIRWIAHGCRAVYAKDGRFIGRRASNRDITDRKNAEMQVEQLAFYDALTGLPNRRMLLDRLNQALSQAKRYQRSLAIMFLDLDNFKKINDILGHDIGDGLLKEVATRLNTCVRTGDTVARQGGDEFIIVLAEIAAPDDAALVADKVIKVLSDPVRVADNVLNVTTSIGIAVYPVDGTDDILELMKKADKAMYAAKAAGRNGYRFFAD